MVCAASNPAPTCKAASAAVCAELEEAIVMVSTPPALRENVAPISAARVCGKPLTSSAFRVAVEPDSLLMTDLLVAATGPDAEPSSVCPL